MPPVKWHSSEISSKLLIRAQLRYNLLTMDYQKQISELKDRFETVKKGFDRGKKQQEQ